MRVGLLGQSVLLSSCSKLNVKMYLFVLSRSTQGSFLLTDSLVRRKISTKPSKIIKLLLEKKPHQYLNVLSGETVCLLRLTHNAAVQGRCLSEHKLTAAGGNAKGLLI